MNAKKIITLEKQYVLQTYARPEFVITRGEGVWLIDSEERRYLDAGSGIAVNALGHGHPAVMEAIQQAMAGPIHLSNLYHNPPMAQLARDLCESCFAERVFFSNSGAEAVEGAIKFARKYARAVLGQEDKTEKYRAPFEPVMPGVIFTPFNDIEAARRAINEKTCAVIVEPIQGEGGVHLAQPEFPSALRQRCDETGALLIFDEVQCGLGRSGALWAHQAMGVEPDIMTIAKPIAGGFPMGAILLTQAVANAITPGDHGSTFAGGTFVSHVARAVFAEINSPGFLAGVVERGKLLEEGLQELTQNSSLITEVRGKGMMWGLVTTIPAADVVKAALAHNLLILSAGSNVIRLLPPLLISEREIELLLEKLQAALISSLSVELKKSTYSHTKS
ncbi:MAG: acetylornithine aminotransferase [Anaerolineaceae bacterium 4572_5.2]|nr:MAG: acetylornithine aminotransferase [Anaerolineaceae bacterium 4572_5.2]